MGKVFHHYVPCHHQRRWFRRGVAGQEVFHFIKDRKLYFGNDVRNILGKKHLYSLFGPGEPDPHLEDAVFSSVDGSPSSVVTRLLIDKNYRLTVQDKRHLAIFLVASVFRTPWGLEAIRDQIREEIEKSLLDYRGIDLDGIDFVPDYCKARFLSNDADYIRRNAPLVAVCNHILKSDLTQNISYWPYVVARLQSRELSFITSDNILMMYGEGKSRVHIAPLGPKICFVSASDFRDLLGLTHDQQRFCWFVNKMMWERARNSIIRFPEAPFLNTLGFARGDADRSD